MFSVYESKALSADGLRVDHGTLGIYGRLFQLSWQAGSVRHDTWVTCHPQTNNLRVRLQCSSWT
jgi:hypothetical protein